MQLGGVRPNTGLASAQQGVLEESVRESSKMKRKCRKTVLKAGERVAVELESGKTSGQAIRSP